MDPISPRLNRNKRPSKLFPLLPKKLDDRIRQPRSRVHRKTEIKYGTNFHVMCMNKFTEVSVFCQQSTPL